MKGSAGARCYRSVPTAALKLRFWAEKERRRERMSERWRERNVNLELKIIFFWVGLIIFLLIFN